MDLSGLSELGKVAGIAGIAIGSLVLIFRSIIHKNFMSKMTVEHSYNITKSIVMIAGIVAVLGMVSYVFMKTYSKDGLKKVIVKGHATNKEGNGIQNLKVRLTINEKQELINTDSEGIFMTEISGVGKAIGSLSIQGEGYTSFTRNINIDFKKGENDLGAMIVAENEKDAEKPMVNKLAQIDPNTDIPVDNNSDEIINQTSYITIVSSDYATLLNQYGALAEVQLTVDGQTFTLTGPDVNILFTETGKVNYSISGYTTFAGIKTCDNQTSGKLTMKSGAKYYFFQDLNRSQYNSCQWYLFSEQQYADQKNQLMQMLQNQFR